MSSSERILVIDPTVLSDTFADLGTKGLDLLLERGGKLFVTDEMIDEIISQRNPEIRQWVNGLVSEQKVLAVGAISQADRDAYLSTQKAPLHLGSTQPNSSGRGRRQWP